MAKRLQKTPKSSIPRRCRMCGCTDSRTCPGGCWWVGRNLCSSCERKQFRDAVAVLLVMAEELAAARGTLWKGMPGEITSERRGAIASVRRWLREQEAANG